MQIPEMFSYVGMKYQKYQYLMKCFLPKNTRWKKELKLNTIATQAVYEHYLYVFICFFSILHLFVLLLSILKYNKYHILKCCVPIRILSILNSIRK